MNCTICGGPYVMGTDMHANCRTQRLAEQSERLAQADRVADLEAAVTSLIEALKAISTRLDTLERTYQDHYHDLNPPPVREIQPVDQVYQPVWRG